MAIIKIMSYIVGIAHRLITILVCHQTMNASVVTNVRKGEFGMIIGDIVVKPTIMVIFVPKMAKMVQDGVPIMVQFIHITMLVVMLLVLVELVDLSMKNNWLKFSIYIYLYKFRSIHCNKSQTTR